MGEALFYEWYAQNKCFTAHEANGQRDQKKNEVKFTISMWKH